MKYILSLLLLISSTSSITFASIIEEEVFISEVRKNDLKMISNHPDLTIDHLSSNGYELYGPRGLKKWLKDVGIVYKEVVHTHHSNNKDSSYNSGYPSFEKIKSDLNRFVSINPNIAKIFSIGKSVNGKELLVVKISDNVNVDEVEPEFKYISSMHGDEITGRELTQFFIRDLISEYGKNEKITSLINNTEIFIMVSMNPDGSKRRRRSNANGVDLNRNFPDWTKKEPNTTFKRQPETVAIMNFQADRNFSLSANFHGGAVVANYPWDSSYNRHPFDGLLQELSLIYADENPEMRNSREFSRGITNGADWYVLRGGMQDWSYFWHNDLQITIELSDRKWPSYRAIPSFYKSNKNSMIEFMKAVHQGAGIKLKSKVKGTVKITQIGTDGSRISRGSYGFQRGEFFKVLPTGDYEFLVKTETISKIINLTVDSEIQNNGNYILVK